MKIYYLASPYTHTDHEVMEQRYQQQQDIAYQLLQYGYHVVTPIEMCHHMSQKHKLPRGYEFWKVRDRALIDICHGIIVCKMGGWDISVGVADEVQYGESLKKEILYFEPSDNRLYKNGKLVI